ncbi:hypothetical protein [Delftia tsuruhatensis]|uniref:hypothetical protein n=1 Tax=Delftia tsuruhatensis TaxID=180282 RepID=UPI0030CE21D6
MTQDTKVPGMAVTALAGEIVEALLADEKDGGYDLTAGLFGPRFSALVRRWASAEWSEIVKEREISDEAIKEAALAAGAAKFYPDAQSKKPWGEESFLVTGGFLQRFARAIHPAPAPEDPRDVDGENQAVRMFLLLYGQPGLTVARMRKHMGAAGWPQVPEWATKPEAQGHLTKAGAQSWLRHLFALEYPETPSMTNAIDPGKGDDMTVVVRRPDIATRIIQRVAELPDRNSPEDWPEAMLVTGNELQLIISEEIVPIVEETARLVRELRRLDEEIKTLRTDAERYRWLRDFHNGSDGVFSGLPYISAGDGNDSAWALTGVTADAGIDAVMAAAKVGDTANAVQQSFLWQEESTPQNSD